MTQKISLQKILEVEIAEWLVEDGDYVEKDQTIAEVDSVKIGMPFHTSVSNLIFQLKLIHVFLVLAYFYLR